MTLDDLGHDVDVPRVARRVVSLVPSITEGLAVARPDALVGATDWCTHPTDLEVARVRGTKNPDRAAIEQLRPDLVVANQEENRELDVRRLREAGVPVWVTRIETVDEALGSLRRLFDEALGWGVPDWLVAAEDAWSGPAPAARGTVVVPIWRDPWMVVGPRTFTADLLRRLGWTVSVGRWAPSAERYPHVELADVDTPDVDLVLLPDEPYVFGPDDGPEAFTSAPTRLVSGRLLTWYGPSLVEARTALDL
ncbi:helical backbone metal receptor [Aeromicrobium sp. 50.2.37]|uniref:helical backbone metal receptor n=1 Tax=Aeromicrobium sp. 50.2.37 TaxID=2969305 RepID=UPI0021502F25|nr:helical backbone metal receptor [Aeromicrobium sp. 50.2.37]MCR4514196.1 helical backbone metal receptor [Aeromicrobium sp. 50.2.37]